MRRIWSIYIMIILFVALSIAVGTGTVGPHGSVYADDVVVGLPSSNGDDAFLVNNSSGLTLMSIWTDGAVDVEPLGTATSIADQKSSGEFTLFGSYWNGAATEHYFSLQNIASIAEAETGRLAISWDNTELMSILNDGKVGIGSNTPTGKLYVNNKNGTENSFRVDDGDSGDPDPDPTPFVIDQNGWVGIRTEYPSASLDVSGDTILNGSVSLHGLFELFNADNSEVVTMDTGPTGTQFKLYNDGTGFSFRIGDQFSDPTPFIIDDEGNVGIGTPNPGAKLEVNGQVKITDGSEGAGLVLTSDASGLASWQAAGGITETDPVYSTAPASGITLLQIGNWDTAFGWVESYTETDPQVGSNTSNFVPRWDGSSLSTGSIYDDGSNVGIGTTTGLSEKLNVEGAIKTTNGGTTRHYLAYGLSNNSYFNIGGGNVGIGTNNPTSKLDVVGTIEAYGLQGISNIVSIKSALDIEFTIDQNDSGSFGYFELFNGSGSNIWSVMENGFMAVTGGATITGGNVGIGTSSPSVALDVNGRIRLSGTVPELQGSNALNLVALGESTGTLGFSTVTAGPIINTRMLISNNGNVGIGTTRPADPLYVTHTVASHSSTNSPTITATVTDGNYTMTGILAGENGFQGVYGNTNRPFGYGVKATATGTGTYGIYASGTDYAGYFSGDVSVTGNVSKGGGSFKIDHPLDPENKYLSHSFVESPDMKNIYDGVVTLNRKGKKWVELPEWFEVLNRDFRYQLTCIGGFAQVFISQEISNNRFQIAGGKNGMKVSWQVTGIRKDPYAELHRIQVEEDKPPDEVGLYLHHDCYNQPKEKCIDYVKHQKNKGKQ